MAMSALPPLTGSLARPGATPLPHIVRIIAVSCLLGAEVIHSLVIEEHINEWLVAGLFFVGLSVTQGILGVALLTRGSLRVIRLVIGVSLATVALWLYSRTAGIPIGPMPGRAEEIGLADSVATILELTTAVVLLARTRMKG